MARAKLPLRIDVDLQADFRVPGIKMAAKLKMKIRRYMRKGGESRDRLELDSKSRKLEHTVLEQVNNEE